MCKNVSDVYNCTYNSRLQDIFMAEDGRGECNCAHCDTEVAKNFTQKYHGTCPDEVDICYGGNETSWNKTMIKTCKGVKCFECKDVSHRLRRLRLCRLNMTDTCLFFRFATSGGSASTWLPGEIPVNSDSTTTSSRN